jgi:23S rRNA A1618 N6-methylase RlmF
MKEIAPYASETGCGHEGTDTKSTEHNIRAEQSILLCLLLVHTSVASVVNSLRRVGSSELWISTYR